VGTAQFTGTSLRALLEEAGPQADAVEALFTGADEGPTTAGQSAPFMRSLPLEVARDPDTLVAWAMNGEPLSSDHGFPVRLVVPRWYGVASVKWLVRVSLLAQAFEGFYQRVKYVFAGDPDLPEGTPVTLMRVRAAVGRPLDGAVVPLGPVQIAGTAWSGYGAVTRVAISADEGRSWSEAEVRRASSPWSAASWRAVWVPERPGNYVLMARASDSAGHIQPLKSVKNSHGYGNNVVQRVALSVRA
jgi:DMSO/TMAO reductase YedYZ molybdopterin-dependent catalytic subunit